MSLKIKINQIIASVFAGKNKQTFEKVLFEDRLIRYDDQIEMEYESLKDAQQWLKFEPIDNTTPFKVSPLQLKAEWKEAGILEYLFLREARNGAILIFKNFDEDETKAYMEKLPFFQLRKSIEYYSLIKQF